jgi:hypothetical protein
MLTVTSHPIEVNRTEQLHVLRSTECGSSTALIRFIIVYSILHYSKIVSLVCVTGGATLLKCTILYVDQL